MNLQKLINSSNQIVLTDEFQDKFKHINDLYRSSRNISDYTANLRQLFFIEKKQIINENYKRFLGGFFLGEGSFNVSLKKKSVLVSVTLDLEFSVTQSIFAVSHLINLLELFKTGRVEFKIGSNATFVFKISSRQSIFEKVLPFWEHFVIPFCPTFEAQRFTKFKKFEDLFARKVHQNKELFIKEMLPLWDSLRKQKGQVNQGFASLEEAIDYVNSNTK